MRKPALFKPIDKLRWQDFERFPVWTFDLEAGESTPGADETWVRPLGPDGFKSLDDVLFVRADLRDKEGKSLPRCVASLRLRPGRKRPTLEGIEVDWRNGEQLYVEGSRCTGWPSETLERRFPLSITVEAPIPDARRLAFKGAVQLPAKAPAPPPPVEAPLPKESWRPIRLPRRPDPIQRSWHQDLLEPNELWGMAILDAPPKVVAKLCGEVVPRWVRDAEQPFEATLHDFGHERFSQRRLDLRTPSGRAALVGALEKRRAIYLRDRRVGFQILFPRQTKDASNPGVPHVILRVAGHGDVEELRALIEKLFLGANGVQAAVGRWSSSPNPWKTAYEECCGVETSEPAHRAQVTSALRAVTREAMWLGPQLLARIDLRKLTAVATVEKLGRAGLRLQLHPRAKLEDLERALEPILPG